MNNKQKQPSRGLLRKGVLKICSKFTGEYPCQSVISIKLQITLRQGCSPVNLLHLSEHLFLRTPLDGCFWIKDEKRTHILPWTQDVKWTHICPGALLDVLWTFNICPVPGERKSNFHYKIEKVQEKKTLNFVQFKATLVWFCMVFW